MKQVGRVVSDEVDANQSEADRLCGNGNYPIIIA